MVVLPGVDALQVGLQGKPGRRALVLALDIQLGLLANAQAAEQGVGTQQLAAEDLGQLATGQAADDLHLEQAVLGMHIAQGAIQISLVLRLDMRHATGVIAHADRRLQAAQGDLAFALRQLVVHVPVTAAGGRGNDHGEEGQAALHRDSLCFLADIVVRSSR
ncbi:hypothetical protein D3C76_1396320 [compost metagenome]